MAKKKAITAVVSSDPVRPLGILSVIGARNRSDKLSEHAVWAEVIVTDEQGKEWIFDVSAFNYAMRPNDQIRRVAD